MLSRRAREPVAPIRVPVLVPLLGALICAALLMVRATTGEAVAPLIAGGLALGILVLYFATRHSHRPAEL